MIRQISSLALVKQPVKEKEKTKFNPSVLHLEIDLVLHFVYKHFVHVSK